MGEMLYFICFSNITRGRDMSRKIILLSDGTGNGAAKQNKTNVWRLYDALNVHRPDQIVFYDDGVGSQEFLPLKLLGGAFGYGLKANVRQLYKFLCHNYKSGDKIYMFGFSRGAFTIRMLTGLIDYCGICTEFDSEQDLDKIARHNYNAFRSQFKWGLLTKLIRSRYDHEKKKVIGHKPEIEFLGLWDTVDAYGLPIDFLAKLWHLAIYPLYFPDFILSPSVKKACHALSVDDERKTFHPVLWDESCESKPDRIEQVWFPGVHSDVGGGYPEASLALVPLDWMISKIEAKTADAPDSSTTSTETEDCSDEKDGLYFIESRRQEFHYHSDWHGKQHDSRALFGAYYRYSPRDIDWLWKQANSKGILSKPKIHRSVFERIKGNVVPYTPTGIPREYEVVEFDTYSDSYETMEEKQTRFEKMTKVGNIIFFRKILHIAMIITTLSLIFSPFPKMKQYLQQINNPVAVENQDTIFAWIMKFLPDLASPWVRTLLNNPWFFYLLLALFVLFFILKTKAWNSTQILANQAWAELKKRDK